MTTIIAARNCGFSYRGTNRRQLAGVSLDIADGERLAVMGATGAGKSTFTAMLNGLVPHHYPGDLYGELIVGGIPTHTATTADLVQVAGVVRQDPESQLTARTVIDDTATGPANLGYDRAEVWQRARDALADVGLADCADQDTAHLSGGQQQRLAVAGILAMQPRLLVLDEPTSELDPDGAARLYAVIDRQAGRSVVLVDHNSDRVLAWADTLLVLSDGQPVFLGDPAEFFTDPNRVQAAGLRLPGAVSASAALRAVGLYNDTRTPRTACEVVQRAAPIPCLARTPQSVADDVVDAPPAIATVGLEHRYASGVVGLAGVDLTIRSGEFVALLGRNGAGKTTLARHLVGLLQPTAGTVDVWGRSIAGRSVAELATEVGYVFQNPDHQIFAATVAEEVAFGLRNQGLDDAEVADRLDEVLGRVHLRGSASAHPFTLGRGDRQRVAVASVLALRPSILIIDEPTTGQDWRGAASIMELLDELHAAGHTIVMITHDMTLAMTHAHRAVVCAAGRVALDVVMPQLFADVDLAGRLGLEAPVLTDIAARLGLGPVATPEQFAAALGGADAS